ncbi:FAD-dependent oxidoreductase [Trichococcus sp.]|uniref:oxidoreductase n=1 Tax=Trichococcus sp. TaxID=1985464 RepID=UPI003C7A25AB
MSDKLIEKKGYIGNLEIKNRLVMTAMGIGYADHEGNATDEIIQFYAERAKGGAGLVFTEITRVNEDNGVGEYDQLSLASDKTIPSFQKLANEIHKYDSKLFIQLHHPGRETYSALIGNKPVVSASAIPCGVCQQETRALETEEVEGLVGDFIDAAVRAKKSGADGIELHAAHGYLIAQFLSSHTNKRTDKYGGSFENRTRFLIEIIKGIKETCGMDYPISVRISVNEFYEVIGVKDGIVPEEGVRIAVAAEKAGADLINVSAGTYETGNVTVEPTSFAQGWRMELAKLVKENVSVPVVATSVIREPEFAEQMLSDGYIDFVGMGRPWLADSQWGEKAINGDCRDIRKCTSCMYCFEIAGTQLISGGEGTTCAINPRLGKELAYPEPVKDGDGRKVVVVGAGPGGLEAARVLAERDFKVTMIEKSDRLGGQMYLSSVPPNKEKMGYFIDYCKKQLEDYQVNIIFNTEATVDMIKEVNPYAVIIATGSAPVKPGSIKGISKDNVFTPDDILSGKVEMINRNISVIGSGLTGLETAEYLAEAGNTVTVFEMMDKIGLDAFPLVLMDVTGSLANAGVRMIPGHKLIEIKDDGVLLEDRAGVIVEHPCDSVILSLGIKPVNSLKEELENLSNVYTIGDADKLGRIAQAVQSGFETAYNLK